MKCSIRNGPLRNELNVNSSIKKMVENYPKGFEDYLNGIKDMNTDVSEMIPLVVEHVIVQGNVDGLNYLTLSKSLYLVVYRGESISRFICQTVWIPCPAKYSVPLPSFALRWSRTSISFSLFFRGALSSKRLSCATPWL